MPRPKWRRRRYKIELTKHAIERGWERLGFGPEELERTIIGRLVDQLAARGVPECSGAYLVDLPHGFVAALELPDLAGRWRVITIRPRGKGRRRQGDADER